MTTFDDLDQFFDPGLVLTVDGTKYRVPAPSAELGLWCQRMTQLAGAISTASTEAEMAEVLARIETIGDPDPQASFAQRMLGGMWQTMADAGVDHHRVEFCARTVYVWIVAGEDKAAQFWRSGGRPEAVSPTPNRAARRAAAKPTKTATAAAGGTRTPASTSGMSSRPISAATGPAKRSRGSRS